MSRMTREQLARSIEVAASNRAAARQQMREARAARDDETFLAAARRFDRWTAEQMRLLALRPSNV